MANRGIAAWGLMLAVAAAGVGMTQTFEPLDLSGEELFERYCAACHGVDARGTGPVARTMSKRVPDLTRLAEAAGVECLVGVSSLSVLDCVRLPPAATIDERTGVNSHGHELGEYARIKRDQEQLLREFDPGRRRAGCAALSRRICRRRGPAGF